MTKAMINIWLMQEHEHLFKNTIVPEFQQLHPEIDVILTTTSWHFLWDKVVMFSKRKQGPDVLQIGSTWNGVLAEIGALKDITANLAAIGGLDIFIKEAAKTCLFPGSGRVSSIPWYLDTRALFYRKEILDIHGFTAHDIGTLEGLEKVSAAVHNFKVGDKTVAAFGLSGQKDAQLVHSLAPWIWNNGGDFMTPDGKRVIFNAPAALQGLEAYFNFINTYCDRTSIMQSYETFLDSFFRKGNYCLAYTGPWVNNTYLNPKHEFYNRVSNHIETALMPGGAAGKFTFLGGSNLAISEFSKHPQEAWELVKFLAQLPVQEKFCSTNHQLPSLNEAYKNKGGIDNTPQRIFRDAVQHGRSLPNSPNWAQIEDILIEYIHRLLVSIAEGIYTVDLLRESIQEAAAKSNAVLAQEEQWRKEKN
ncbi:MAG: extracellular solute-binding protein [bacterium]|jgi:multiple sugar transport system substrate-binding protein|nr:extracellular solute-binding protein [bacterium]